MVERRAIAGATAVAGGICAGRGGCDASQHFAPLLPIAAEVSGTLAKLGRFPRGWFA